MKRIILLTILFLEGLAGIIGGIFLVIAPDGHLMQISVARMHGIFPNFLIPGIFLTGMGLLTTTSFVSVFLKSRSAQILARFALMGFVIWFGVEIAVLREIYWLHIVWGVPILVGLWISFSQTS